MTRWGFTSIRLVNIQPEETVSEDNFAGNNPFGEDAVPKMVDLSKWDICSNGKEEN